MVIVIIIVVVVVVVVVRCGGDGGSHSVGSSGAVHDHCTYSNCSCGRGRHIRYTGGYSNCGRSGHELVAMVLIL